VPCAAEIGAGLEDGGLDPEIDQALDLIEAGDARADDDDFVVLHVGQSGTKTKRRHRRMRRCPLRAAMRT